MNDGQTKVMISRIKYIPVNQGEQMNNPHEAPSTKGDDR